MPEETQLLPLDKNMCLDQFRDMLGFVFKSQGLPETEKACELAEEISSGLFEAFYKLPGTDRYEFLIYLAYTSMNIAANISYLVNLAEINAELEGE